MDTDLNGLEVSNMRLEFYNDGAMEMKWYVSYRELVPRCLFVTGKRASIGKLIAEIAPTTNSWIASFGLKSNEQAGKIAHVKSVFIHKDYRGKHLSKVLMNQCKRVLAENGFDRLTLEAEEDNSRYGKLVELYKQCGFTVVGDESNVKYEYNDDECFRKVPMACWLKPRVFANQTELKQDGQPKPSENVEDDEPGVVLMVNLGSEDHVKELRARMSYDYVAAIREEALVLERAQWTIVEAFHRLEEIHPGTLARGIFVAKYIRDAGHPDWLQLAGLVHQLGKLEEAFLWRTPYDTAGVNRRRRYQTKYRSEASAAEATSTRITNPDDAEDDRMLFEDDRMNADGGMQKGWPLPEWSRCDETESWVVGMPLPPSLPFPELNSLSPDHQRLIQDGNPQSGFYRPYCGLDNCLLTWGASEYLSIVLRENKNVGLPREVARIIRFQNLYAWSQRGFYKEIMDDPTEGGAGDDEDSLEWVRLFQELLMESMAEAEKHRKTGNASNSKLDFREVVDVGSHMDFVNSLLDKYLPSVLNW